MGSVVLDAVNSFFGHSSSSHADYAYREAPRAHNASPQPRRSRAPEREKEAEAHMSASGQRAPSSAGRQTAQHAPVQETPQGTAESSERAQIEPPSPRLTANTAPPESVQPAAEAASAADTVTAEARPRKIKVRDLEHIQSFASEDMGAFSEIQSRSRSRSRGSDDDSPQYEISEMKVEHIIEMVAGLLTKITTTNDQQHEHLHRQPAAHALEGGAHLTAQTSSVLAFHGKNIPSITILQYLSRINKYCPTSYEVFLSLLVYFDRMTERVNAGPMQHLREANQQAYEQNNSSGSSSSESSTTEDAPEQMEGVVASTVQGTQTATPPASGSLERAVQDGVPGTPHSRPRQEESPGISAEPSATDAFNLSHFFVVDSFNIHRLVIAGVTCASKFFSDIYYTNSRYAKVSLNHTHTLYLARLPSRGPGKQATS